MRRGEERERESETEGYRYHKQLVADERERDGPNLCALIRLSVLIERKHSNERLKGMEMA